MGVIGQGMIAGPVRTEIFQSSTLALLKAQRYSADRQNEEVTERWHESL